MTDLSADVAALPDRSLLVLDDDAPLRTRLGRALEQRGFEPTLVGSVADHTGRHGWELTLSMPAYGTQSYIVDPESGSLLESRVRFPGEPLTWATYLSAGPATSAPAATE